MKELINIRHFKKKFIKFMKHKQQSYLILSQDGRSRKPLYNVFFAVLPLKTAVFKLHHERTFKSTSFKKNLLKLKHKQKSY